MQKNARCLRNGHAVTKPRTVKQPAFSPPFTAPRLTSPTRDTVACSSTRTSGHLAWSNPSQSNSTSHLLAPTSRTNLPSMATHVASSPKHTLDSPAPFPPITTPKAHRTKRFRLAKRLQKSLPITKIRSHSPSKKMTPLPFLVMHSLIACNTMHGWKRCCKASSKTKVSAFAP